ncbi:NAD(P)H-dependent flavin oxidoreductase [Bacillus massiliigorillae]|uniref:NAD(P)H-dependent flavin oxidoreductase n=1 Tax=Bacillus massiliigorillae TaxID=1243664 RepID=UPI0003AA3E06|nr:nitronate monooxygenase [Bacillus massiliigorillae]
MLDLQYPIIQAPMAGGVSNPTLASAVSNAGGLGFLAAGYKSSEALKQEITEVRKLTTKAFGVNIFVPSSEDVNEEELVAYGQKIEKEAEKLGTSIGKTVADDDDWQNKLQLMVEENVPIVSFTFGCPSSDIIRKLQNNGTYVIISVTNLGEATLAANSGANALCLQGMEAGGHRASFSNKQMEEQEFTILDFISIVRQNINLPIIAAGGLMDGQAIQQVLNAGASAAQLGTAFLCCPESGTNPVHREALISARFTSTAVTRAFTGRRARGLVNEFLTAYTEVAPAAYPHIHQMTQPLRKSNNVEYMSLWAGEGFKQCRELPAAALIEILMEEQIITK